MPAELDAWLELTKEDALDPGLPICDPHHHLWDKPGDRYMIDEVTRDFATGHNIVQSLFVEVDSMYRASGPVEMKPVGEVEWVRGLGALSDSGNYGPTKVAAGIVVADLLFAALALWGMTELAQQLGSLFALVRIAAGLWLVWFGITLIRNRDTALKTGAISGSSKTVSFLAGLAVTLGDIKAIVFYASLFPLFVNMHAPDVAHLVVVLLITVFSVGGVKAVYACLAQRISRRSNPRLRQPLSIAAGGAMIGAGTWLVTRP